MKYLKFTVVRCEALCAALVLCASACGSEKAARDPNTAATGGDTTGSGGTGGSSAGSSGDSGTGATGGSSGGSAGGGSGGDSGKGGSGAAGSGGSSGDTTNPPVEPGTPVPGKSGATPLVPGTWQDITPSQGASACTDITFDPSNPSTLYAMFADSGSWKSTDSGATWVNLGNMPRPVSLGRIRVDPRDPMHLYATGGVTGNSWGFWVSRDGGETWAQPGAFIDGALSTYTNDVYNLIVDPDDFDHFILTSHRGWTCCGEDAGVIESTDGGETFIAHMPPTGMNHGNGGAILRNKATGEGDGNTWLIGGGYSAGMWRTADAGQTWTRVSEEQDNHGGFYANYSAQGFLYVGVANGIARSTDNGVSWTLMREGLGGWYYGAVSDGNFLYTGQAYVGVENTAPIMVSPEGGADEGTTWTAYNDQVMREGPFRMVVEPQGRIIYAASWGAGAWALKIP